MRRELAAFLAGRVEWPRQADMIAAGRSDLLGAVNRSGGARRWAEEFGLPVKPSGRKVLWSDEDIRNALTQVLANRDDWPTRFELECTGPYGLAAAIARHPRGFAYWAREFGFEPRTSRVWTDERIRRELRSFLDGRGEWPTQSEFIAAERIALLKAIYRHGGTQRWAKEFGFSVRPPGPNGHSGT